MRGKTDAVIGEAVLGKVIGADLFVAFARTDLLPAGGLDFAALFFPLFFEKTRSKNAHGGSTVFDLGAAILATDNEAGGKVKDLDGGVGRVDPLAAGTAGATNFNADFIGADLKFDFFGHRKNGDSGGGGVDAALGFGGGHALDAMDAAFMAHGGKDSLARQFENDFFEPAQIGGAGGEGFKFPAAVFGVAAVHTKEVTSKDGRFGTTRAGPNFHDGVAMLVGIGGKNGAKNFGFGGGFIAVELDGLLFGHLAHFGVRGRSAQGGIFQNLGSKGDKAPSGFGAEADAGMFAGEIARAGALAVKVGCGHFAIQLLQAGFEPCELSCGIHKREGGAEPAPRGEGTGSPRERLRALFRLRGGGGSVEAAAEFFHTASGVDQLLGASEERVTRGANTKANLSFGGAGVVGGAASAGHDAGFKFGMNFGLHWRKLNQTRGHDASVVAPEPEGVVHDDFGFLFPWF